MRKPAKDISVPIAIFLREMVTLMSAHFLRTQEIRSSNSSRVAAKIRMWSTIFFANSKPSITKFEYRRHSLELDDRPIGAC